MLNFKHMGKQRALQIPHRFSRWLHCFCIIAALFLFIFLTNKYSNNFYFLKSNLLKTAVYSPTHLYMCSCSKVLVQGQKGRNCPFWLSINKLNTYLVPSGLASRSKIKPVAQASFSF